MLGRGITIFNSDAGIHERLIVSCDADSLLSRGSYFKKPGSTSSVVTEFDDVTIHDVTVVHPRIRFRRSDL